MHFKINIEPIIFKFFFVQKSVNFFKDACVAKNIF